VKTGFKLLRCDISGFCVYCNTFLVSVMGEELLLQAVRPKIIVWY
jgi:hypothetical protein